MRSAKNYLVSALVTTYNSERFMRGLLEDLEAQTIADQLEIVIVDSNSPQNEGAIVGEYQKKYDNIVYHRTEDRESSHAAWNRCIHLARGKYFTIACTDDRHRPDALELMVRVLEEYPEYGLVYADSLITTVENETFEQNSATKRYDWPDYNLGTALSSCIFGPQPVWRRDVHKKAGYFNPSIWIAGDHDLFLRIAWRCGAVHLRETLGLFLKRDDSNSGRNHRNEVVQDVLKVMQRYRKQIPIEDIYPHLGVYAEDPLAKAAAYWHLGNLCALSPYNDFELAIKNYQKALSQQKLPAEFESRLKTMHWHNVGLLLYCLGEKQKGRDYLMRSQDLPTAQTNLKRMAQLERKGEPAIPTDFDMLELQHPVVMQAYRTNGLRLGQNGALVQTVEHEQVFWDVYTGPNGIPVSNEEKAQAAARKPRILNNSQSKDCVNKRQTHKTKLPLLAKSELIKMQHQNNLNIFMTMYGWADEGGGTIHPRQVAKGLARKGHQVTVIYTAAQLLPHKPDYYVEARQEDGVQLFAVYNRPSLLYDLENPEREINDPQMRDIVVRLIEQFKPDIVHYQGLVNFSMRVAEDVARLGIPGVYTAYNYWPICPRLYLCENDLTLCRGPSTDGRKCASCIGRLDKISGYSHRVEQNKEIFNTFINLHLAVSKKVRHIFEQNGFKAFQTKVLYQPSVTTDWLWDTIGKSRRPARTHKPPLKVGFIGSLLPQKGVHIFISALQNFNSAQIEGHVYGYGTEAYKNRLQQLDKKGLVYFHGRYELEHLPNLLRQVDVTVIPSICEDCAPFVVQESLAAGCPVIGSRIGGIPEFIDECVNGFIFEPGDASSLTNILRRFIQDATLLERLQNKIQPPRSFDDYLDLLIDYYNDEISKNGLNLKSQSSTKKELSRKVHSMVNTPNSHSAKNNRGRSIRQKYSLYHIHGREEILKEWMSPYADIFIGCTNVLDVGCGPGLFLELLKDRGIPSIGFDHDPDMIDICHTKNLNAKLADERTLFTDQEEFDGIHLGHVIEHMDGPAMVTLLESCVTALGAGGLLLIRTPNWQNESVRNGGFWLDYTHVRPYPLELLERIYLDIGLEIVKKGYEPNGWNDIYILGQKHEKIKSKKQSQINVKNTELPAFSIVWEGSQFVYHSLALINRELCLQLIDRGYEVSIIPYEPDQFDAKVDKRFQKLANRVQGPLSKPADIHVRHQWPPNLTPPKEGHWVIIQPWEFGSLPKQWVDVFSTQVDECWVPSEYLRQVYVQSGVPSERVVVVPNGINPDKFHPGVKPIKLRTKKKFKFLFVGGAIQRKGVDLLLNGYVEAFKKTDDVCLVIKDMGGDSFYKGITFRDHIRKLKRRKNVPAIEYIDKSFPEEELAGLYAACEVLVHPYRGEGFGLPILEAMACGIPAIVTNGGACLDFCHSENSLLINAKKQKLPEKRVGALETVGYPYFYEVAMDDLKRKMFFAFQHPAQMKALGKQASQEIQKQWTWGHSAKIIAERLAHLKNLPLQRTDGNKNIDWLFQKGHLLVEKGKLVAGLKVLSKLLELKPNHCATLKLMGDLYQQLGKESEAQQMWDLALTQQPTNQKLT